MSKIKKLRQRIEQNPKNVSFSDLRKLLEYYGFELKRTKGSHNSFVGMVAGQKKLLVVPLDQPLQAVYVKMALDFIAQIEIETSEEADESTDDDE